MKKKEKELLLRDLCCRLPYGVKVLWNGHEGKRVVKLYKVRLYGKGVEDYTINGLAQPEPGYEFDFRICEEVKPYLRPMSSMTEEEKIDFVKVFEAGTKGFPNDLIDFYHEHHLDYRGLIKKGLALEAPDDMYKIKK